MAVDSLPSQSKGKAQTESGPNQAMSSQCPGLSNASGSTSAPESLNRSPNRFDHVWVTSVRSLEDSFTGIDICYRPFQFLKHIQGNQYLVIYRVIIDHDGKVGGSAPRQWICLKSNGPPCHQPYTPWVEGIFSPPWIHY